MKMPEILAPAGDFICLQAAIDAGADAVYFGLGEFNMRQRAGVNFTIDDLPEIQRRCEAAPRRFRHFYRKRSDRRGSHEAPGSRPWSSPRIQRNGRPAAGM